MLVHNFYNGLMGNTHTLVDVASCGAFMRKSVNTAYKLLEEMALNDLQWPSAWNGMSRVAGVSEHDAISRLTSLVEILSRMLQGSSIQASVQQINQFCEGGHHSYGLGPFVDVNILPMEQVQAIGSYPSQNNPYSNSCNPGWRNHPNFSWRNDQHGQASGQPQQQMY